MEWHLYYKPNFFSPTPYTQLHKHQSCFSCVPYLNKWFHHLMERPKICFYIICSLAFALISLFQLSLTVCAFLQPYQTTYAGLPKEMCSWLSLCILLPSSFPDSSNSGFNSTRQLYLPNFLQLNQLALIFLLMHLQPCLTGLMVILTTCLSKTSL